MRLGRLAPPPGTLAAAPSHRLAALPVPEVCDRPLNDWQPGLYGNDVYPCCTITSYVNLARQVAHLAGGELVVDPARIPAVYADMVGVPLSSAASTDGALMLDVIGWQGAHGVDIGEQAPLVAGQSGTAPVTRTALASAIAHHRGAWTGVMLHDREMQTWGPGRVWTTDGDPGPIAGGHAVTLWCYDAARVWLSTWGVWQAVTWDWLLARCDEAHVLNWPDWISGGA